MCTFPLEYCEFGSSFTKCKEWLQKEDSALYDKYYSEGTCPPPNSAAIRITQRTTPEAMQAKLGTLSLEAQSKLEKDTAKKEAKAEAKADAALKKKMVHDLPLPPRMHAHIPCFLL